MKEQKTSEGQRQEGTEDLTSPNFTLKSGKDGKFHALCLPPQLQRERGKEGGRGVKLYLYRSRLLSEDKDPWPSFHSPKTE